jgi:hypothetical protein
MIGSPTMTAALLTGGGWSLLRLFANGQFGGLYDPSDLSTLFQDSAGTIPVTAHGDPVGKMLDKSRNGLHMFQSSSSLRPIFQTDGIARWLRGDNTTYMTCSFTARDARGLTAIMSATYEDVVNDTSNVIFSLGNSGIVTPYMNITDQSSNWIAMTRTDTNLSFTATGPDDTNDDWNGHVFSAQIDATAISLWVDEAQYSTVAAIGSITVNQAGLFCLNRTTVSNMAKARFFGGCFVFN